MGLLFRFISKGTNRNLRAEFQSDKEKLTLEMDGTINGEVIELNFQPIGENEVQSFIDYLERVKYEMEEIRLEKEKAEKNKQSIKQ